MQCNGDDPTRADNTSPRSDIADTAIRRRLRDDQDVQPVPSLPETVAATTDTDLGVESAGEDVRADPSLEGTMMSSLESGGAPESDRRFDPVAEAEGRSAASDRMPLGPDGSPIFEDGYVFDPTVDAGEEWEALYLPGPDQPGWHGPVEAALAPELEADLESSSGLSRVALLDSAFALPDLDVARWTRHERRQALGEFEGAVVDPADGDLPGDRSKVTRDDRLRCAADLRRGDVWVNPVTDTVEVGSIAERVRFDLDQLLCVDPDECDGADLMADLLAIQDLQSYLHSAAAQRLAVLARPGVAGDPSRLVARRLADNPMVASLTPEQRQVVADGETVLVAEQLAVAQLGAVLKISPTSASRRVHESIDLVEQLPCTLIALIDGRIDRERAKVLAERSAVLRAELRAELERRVLPQASDCTPRQWRSLVDAEIIALDPDAAEQRRRDAVERRRLRLEPMDDGVARLLAALPAHQAQLAWDLFDAVAEGLRGLDERTLDQRRADAFITIIELLAAGETVSVAGILGHPEMTRHDTCCHPEYVAGKEWDSPTPPCPDPHDEPENASGPNRAEYTDASAEAEAGAGAEVGAGAEAGAGAEVGAESGAGASGEAEVDGDAEAAAGPVSSPNAAEHGSPLAMPAVPATTAEADSGAPEPAPAADELSAPARSYDLSTTDQPAPACEGPWSMPTKQGRQTHSTVVLTLEALGRLLDDPAQLEGHGVITAEYARALAESARSVSVLVVGANGEPVAAGARAYRPPQALRDKVITAYPRCVFVGCTRRAVDDDLDHTDTFNRSHPEQGGATTAENLRPLCRHHHRLKTFTDWSYRPADSGELAMRARPAREGRPARPARPGRAATPAALVFRSPLGIESVSRIDHIVRPRSDDPAPF